MNELPMLEKDVNPYPFFSANEPKILIELKLRAKKYLITEEGYKEYGDPKMNQPEPSSQTDLPESAGDPTGD